MNTEKNDQVTVAAFYRFVKLPDHRELKEPMLAFCKEQGIRGTILLATEGINSTIAGSADAMAAFFAWLGRDDRFHAMERKLSHTAGMPFRHMKIRFKQEIVRMGVAELDATRAGQYADAAAWEELLADPDVVVVDTRNDYEVNIGTFKGALNPDTKDFQQFPVWADANLDPARHRKVAMFCTGGIRCEKSTSYLRAKGFEEVYHLKGGILQYLEDTGNQRGLWQGECFVFDDRVALDASLQPTGATRCTECGDPVKAGEACHGMH